MANEIPASQVDESPLTKMDIAMLKDALRGAADHSLGADRIKRLPGFNLLPEETQVLVAQRADQVAAQCKANEALGRLEDEWKRWVFDRVIAPKIGKAAYSNEYSLKMNEDAVFYAVLRLAEEQKWDTLESFLNTAATAGKEEAYKHWRQQEGPARSSLIQQILWVGLEVVFITCLLVFVQHGLSAIVLSCFVLVYAILSSQLSSLRLLILLNAVLVYLPQKKQWGDTEAKRLSTAFGPGATDPEEPGNVDRNVSQQRHGDLIRRTALAVIAILGAITLVAKGIL